MSWKALEDTKVSLNYSANAVSVDYIGKYAALGARRGLCIIALDRAWERKTFYHNKKSEVGSVQFSPHAATSTYVANSVADTVQVWDIANITTPLLSSFKGHQRAVTGLTWSSADPNTIATCSADSFIHLWDIRDENKTVRSFCAFTGGPSQIRWNPLSSHIIASAHDGEVRIWDTRKTDTYVAFITAHLSNILCLDWSPKFEDQLVTCGQDRQIKIWNYNQPKEYKFNTTTAYPVHRVRYTPFGEGLVTVSQKTDFQVRLWSLNNATDSQDIANINVFYGHTDVIKSFDFRVTEADNKNYQLVTWSKDQTLRMWSFTVPMQEECGHFLPHTNSHPNQIAIPNTDTSPPTPLNSTPTEESTLIPVVSSFGSASKRKAVDHMDLASMNYSQECKKVERELAPDIIVEGINARNRCCVFRVETRNNTLAGNQLSPSSSCVRLQVSFPLLYPNGASPMFEFLQSKSSLSIHVMKELKEKLTTTANELVSHNRHCMLQCMSGMLDILKTMNLPENNAHNLEDSSIIFPQPSPVHSMVRQPSHPALNTLSVDGNLYVDYPLQSPFKSKPIYGGIERVERVVKKTLGVRVLTPPIYFATFSPTGHLIFVNNFSGQLPFQKLPRYYDQLRSLMAGSKPSTTNNSPSSTSVTPIPSPQAVPSQLSPPTTSSSNTNVGSALSTSLIQQNVDSQDYFQNIFSSYSGGHEFYNVPNIPTTSQLGMTTSSTTSSLTTTPNTATSLNNALISTTTTSIPDSTISLITSTQEISVKLKLDTRVHIYDVRSIHPISYALADKLSVSNDETISELCMRNSVACAREGYRSLAQMWELVAKSADPNFIDTSSWVHHPMGKKLMDRFIQKYMRIGDVQTVSVLSCVLMRRQEDGLYDHWLLDRNMENLYRFVRNFYADILHLWGYDCQRSEILKFNHRPLVSPATIMIGEYDSRVLKCVIELDDTSDETRPKNAGLNTPFHCFLCRLPVRGLNMICVVCGHGGHAQHVCEWFSRHDMCPTGCTCHCIQHMGEYPHSNSIANLASLPNPQIGHSSTVTNASINDTNLHDLLNDNSDSTTSTTNANNTYRRSRNLTNGKHHHHHGKYPPDLAPLNTSSPPKNPSLFSQEDLGTEEAQSAPTKRASLDFPIRPSTNPASAIPSRSSMSKVPFPYFKTYQY
jgi:WD40 repeat protein